MSKLLNKIKNVHKTSIRNDIDYFETQFKTKSKAMKKTARNVVLLFDSFMQKEEATKEQLFEAMESSENPDLALITLINDFIQYLNSERPCDCNSKGCTKCKFKGMKEPLSYQTIRLYTHTFRHYLEYYGFEKANNIQLTSKIEFPIQIREEVMTMTHQMVYDVIHQPRTHLRKTLYGFLATSGCRIFEACSIKKSDMVCVDRFGEVVDSVFHPKFRRILVRLRGETTKKKKTRRTYVSDQIIEAVWKRLESIDDDSFVFHKQSDPVTATKREENGFHHIRESLGKKDSIWNNRYKTGTHHYSLHSFRKFFVNNANEVDRIGFGHKIAGHESEIKVRYDSLTLEKEISLYNLAEAYLRLDGQKFRTESKEVIDELKKQLVEERKKNQDNENKFEKLLLELNQSFEDRMARQQEQLIETFLKSKKRK